MIVGRGNVNVVFTKLILITYLFKREDTIFGKKIFDIAYKVALAVNYDDDDFIEAFTKVFYKRKYRAERPCRAAYQQYVRVAPTPYYFLINHQFFGKYF